MARSLRDLEEGRPVSMSDPTLRLVFVDLLFLGLAAGMAFWFRAWLREQKAEMDQRLETLESQQQTLARLCERLGSACRTLERQAPAAIGDALTRSRAPTAPVPTPEVSRETPRAAERTTVPPGPASADRRLVTPASRADRQWEEMSDRSRDAYRQARELLDQGLSSAEIARRVGLGVAEVNVLKRMRDAGRR
jgi:hypothetical protein